MPSTQNPSDFHTKYLSHQKICPYSNHGYALTQWDITDLDLLQIEKYTLAEGWILKSFLNCLNASFFGNLTNTGKRESRGKGRRGEEMEGFKETHNERKLFFKYTTVLLLCKSTECSGVVKAKIHHLQSWAHGNAWSGVYGKASASPAHNEPVWDSGQDTRTTWMDEGTRSHTLTGQCCAWHGQTSTAEKWNTVTEV